MDSVGQLLALVLGLFFLYSGYRALVTGTAGLEFEFDRDKHPRLFRWTTALHFGIAAVFFAVAGGLL